MNSVRIKPIGNSVEVKLFNVESEWYFMTQFMPFKHHKKAGEDDDRHKTK